MEMVFKFSGFLVKEKINLKFLHASWKTLSGTNSKCCFESRIRISVTAFHLCHWSIFLSVHVKGSFRIDFRIKAAFEKSCLYTLSERGVTGWIFRVCKRLGKNKQTLYFYFFPQISSQ
jgi:hypothetical protein